MRPRPPPRPRLHPPRRHLHSGRMHCGVRGRFSNRVPVVCPHGTLCILQMVTDNGETCATDVQEGKGEVTPEWRPLFARRKPTLDETASAACGVTTPMGESCSHRRATR